MTFNLRSLFSLPLLIAVCLASGCGDGNSTHLAVSASNVQPDVQPNVQPNGLPIASADTISVTVNTPTRLNLFANDTDADGILTGYRIDSHPSNGSLQISGANITYIPNDAFLGADSFTYSAIDDRGAVSNSVSVNLTIMPIAQTRLLISALNVPTSGYEALNNPDLNATLLTSNPLVFNLPANSVSFGLYLTGQDVENNSDGLLITSLTDPDNVTLAEITRFFEYCSPGLCAGLLPRRSNQVAVNGDWQLTLGTRAQTLDSLRFDDVNLTLALRTGPVPDLTTLMPATLKVTPYLSATSVSAEQFAQVLNEFVALNQANGIAVDLQPTVLLTAPQYAEVSMDFFDPVTAEMVTQGAADSINIFFVDSFSGPGGAGQLGISPGIPGTLGVKGPHNGILINATATLGGTAEFYARTTAEFAFHEMGHLLGLLHTTESNFDNDIIDDSPACLQSLNDANNNHQADVSECPDGQNPMFWTSDLATQKQPLSAGQKRVIYFSPIARP